MLRALVVGRAGSHLLADVAELYVMFLALAVAMPGSTVAHHAEDWLADLRCCLGYVRSHEGLAPDLARELLDNGSAELVAVSSRRMFDLERLLSDPAQDRPHTPALRLAQPRISFVHDIPPLS